jgi:2-succinyl-5-enolpyruvyl-6-hydroxy-3-cyclohexene-1-carboxylate synthase
MTAVDSHLFLRALIDEFVRCGAEHAVACPGSRNTPIVLRLAADERLKTWSQIDERSAAFFALGIAKKSGKPVILTCTSGTAAANFLPAIIEAKEARIPLIVLTADRPPELQQIGAGQTIDQTKIYGDNVKWFFDTGVPESSPERLRWARALACRSYWTASQGASGPVHLNVPLREPLILEQPLPVAEPGAGGRADGSPWVTQTDPLQGSAAVQNALADGFRVQAERTVWIAGDLGPDPELGRRLSRLAAAAQIPLLADPLSRARSGPSAIAHFDLILRDPGTSAALDPSLVVRFGELPTSKPLRQWLDRLNDCEHVLIARDDHWTDPASQLGRRVIGNLGAILSELESRPTITDDSGWLQRWTSADSKVAHAIAEPLLAAALSEPAVATMLGQFLPEAATLFVAASMPIRDVEEFFPALAQPPQVMANRGANGIDGTIATAFGVAAAADGPVVLLVGDVTVAHDLGSLITAARNDLKLTIVLVNNEGGGIFNFLPVVREGAPFEEFVATAPGLDFSKVAALYGFGHALLNTSEQFITALVEAIGSERGQVLEVRTNRAENRELHSEVERFALNALRSSGGADQPDSTGSIA